MEIPVFCYHNAVAPGLEKDLSFLADNGYRTLGADELVDALTGVREPPDKPVVLTFDDGLLSVKTIGLPLLERYDARATVFVITGLVAEERTSVAIPDSAAAEDDHGRLLSWNDLADLRHTGRFDVGAHGHRHNPVFIDPGPGPGIVPREYPRLYDVPVPYTEGCDAATLRAAAGGASHPWAPLFGARQVLVDGALVDAEPLIAADLGASAALLRQRLGVERQHLCLPYGAGSDEMPRLARDAGFESLFWSGGGNLGVNRVGDDPYRIVRRKHDFVRRLPGHGRRSRLDVLITKVKRRLTSDPWQ